MALSVRPYFMHIYTLPYAGSPIVIVPEGLENIHSISGIGDLQTLFFKDGKYLFFSIGDSLWTVDTNIGVPRFFRDRFAKALGAPERGNWKIMETNSELMQRAQSEILLLKKSGNNTHQSNVFKHFSA